MNVELQIIDSKGRHRRSAISPDGVLAVLQVTSSCLAEVLGTSTYPADVLTERDTSSNADPVSSNTTIDFSCPLARSLGGSEQYKRTNTSIRVTSVLSIDQLIFSGASLRLQSIESDEN
ncbi:unnamed protein product [Phytophthora fragariaefolia]|uniref:Unnamed protein product n=1 Tax=Phytophthora fragariaefolia TaxID=1490495 RepID=A0A9W6XFR2_9STRA|nr:unnamed protein product [Phytophthora fragariaefolia]